MTQEDINKITKWLDVRRSGGWKSQEDEWLRALLEENKRYEECAAHDRMDIGSLQSERNDLQSELQQTREELEQEKAVSELFDQRGETIERLLDEIEQVKAERDSLQLNLDTQVRHFNETTEELEKAFEDADALESELSAKDKLLMDIKYQIEQSNHPAGLGVLASINSILKEYEVKEHG